MQFQTAIKSSLRNSFIQLITAKEYGVDCWFYIQLDKKTAPIFDNEIKTGNIKSLAKYGQIIHSGWGKNPPEEIKKPMEE